MWSFLQRFINDSRGKAGLHYRTGFVHTYFLCCFYCTLYIFPWKNYTSSTARVFGICILNFLTIDLIFQPLFCTVTKCCEYMLCLTEAVEQLPVQNSMHCKWEKVSGMIEGIETEKQRSSIATSGDEILTQDKIGVQCENETKKMSKESFKENWAKDGSWNKVQTNV